MAQNLGVYPVFDIEFKVGIQGRESSASDMVVVKEMETFSPSIDTNIEEWTPMDTAGWARRLATGKGFAITLNGKRHEGDPGNDYIAGLAWKSGTDLSTKAEIVFPDGDKLTFDCVVNVTTPFGGDSTNVSGLEFELQSDGKPEYVPAGGGV
ncbi:phage tail tube protein [Sporosarcina sp. USHLN248]|uniref:phage tail tube protein n=1 Tax=Sporosarcina sp. USHLN248 TaxID=3081300 RepID=UPI0030167D80